MTYHEKLFGNRVASGSSRWLVTVIIFALAGFAGGRITHAVRLEWSRTERDRALVVGATLPNPLIHLIDGGSVRLMSRQPSADRRFLVAIFQPGCASCIGDAIVWEELHKQPPAATQSPHLVATSKSPPN